MKASRSFLFSCLVLLGLGTVLVLINKPRATAEALAARVEQRKTSLPLQPRTAPLSARSPETLKHYLVQAYSKLPLSFEANHGQTDSQVKFLSRGSGYSLFLTSTEAVISLRKPLAPKPQRDAAMLPRPPLEQAQSAVVRMKLVGANPRPEISGLDELPGKSNYFIGNDPAKWRTNVPTYAKVRYENVYPGIDLVYYGNQGQLEYDLVVAPGADPSSIRLEMAGADKLELDPQGDLILRAGGDSELRLRKPLVYQQVAGRRREVAGNYVLLPNRQVRFSLDGYDRSQPLIVDPTLVYSTFLGGGGGNGYDYGFGIAADSSGFVYVTGQATSNDFPTTPGAFQTSPSDGSAFVAKLDTTKSGAPSLVYSTRLGGASNAPSSGTAIALDPGCSDSCNVYVTGVTFNSFPGTSQTFYCNANRGTDFVAKLNSSGSGLLYSVCINDITIPGGGGTVGGPAGIAVDSSGNAYIAGAIGFGILATPVNGYNGYPSPAGFWDAYVTKLNWTASAIVYSTYLGGASNPNASTTCGPANVNSGNDRASGIAVDSAGYAYITGFTNSCDFPTTPGAYQPIKPGTPSNETAFVAKINTTATGVSSLVYSTFLGGTNGNAYGNGIAVDSSGYAYVAGSDSSDTFPTTAGAFLQANTLGTTSAFLTKLNAAGSALLYSTYLAGAYAFNSTGSASAIAVHSPGYAYLTGWVHNPLNFPTVGAFQSSFGGTYADAFVAKLDTLASGTASLVYSSFLGGSGGFCCGVDELGRGIAVDTFGDAYVTGYTSSGNFPTVNAYQSFNAGGHDVFVAKITSATLAVTNLSVASATGSYGGTVSLMATLTSGSVGVSGKSISFTLNGIGVGSTVTDGNGVAILSSIGLTGFSAGTYSSGVGANFAGDVSYGASSGTAALTINAAPAITSANLTTFTIGLAGSITVTATGFPSPTLSESGSLPSGVTFNATTGVLSGVPAAGTAGTYNITFTASNGVGSNAVQNFTLTVTATTSAPAPVSFAGPVNYTTAIGDFPCLSAVGDFNGDGKLDLAVGGGNRGDFVSVLLGNGDGTFQASASYSADNTPCSVAVGDFNGDGKRDLAVGNINSGDVSILLGNGNGTFQSPVNYLTGFGPEDVAVGDFNGDGKLDLAVANYDGTVSVLLGNGDGTFQPAVNYGAGSHPLRIKVGDLDGDGRLDLVVVNESGDTVSVLLGNGNGTFRSPVSYGAGSGARGVAIEDFNGDGKPDLGVANFNSNTVSVLLGDVNGTFHQAVSYVAGSNALGVAIGDFNGDGKRDLAVANYSGNNVSVLLGNGDANGTFQPAVNFGAATQPWSVVVGDFNGDGKPDLAVANSGSHNISVLLNTTMAVQIAPTVSFTGAPASALYQSTFSVNATTNASTTAVITASGACTIAGNNVTMTSGTGNCSLTANWPADSNYLAASASQTTTAQKIGQTITFTQPPSPASYGSTFPVSPTSDSGLTVTAQASGGCSINSGTVTMSSGTNACTLTASQDGDGNYNAATNVVRTVAAQPANLTITPDGSKSKTYGTIFTAFTGTVTGLQNSDAGTPSYASTGAAAAAAVGSYDIISSFSFSSGSPSNYNITTNTATGGLTVNPANTTTTVSSSLNPSTFGQSVTFTATVTGIGAMPTGTGSLQFLDSGLLLGTAALSNGTASFATAALAAGTHYLTASYSGDSNYNGSNSANLMQNVSVPISSSVTTASFNEGSTTVSVAFSNISQSGAVTVTPINPSSAGSVPGGFHLSGLNLAFDISTTATFSGQITICFTVASSDPSLFSSPYPLRILHNVNGKLVDQTILKGANAPSYSVAAGGGSICAKMTSLSPFVFAIATDFSPPVFSNVTVTPNPVAVSTAVTLSATVDDSSTGNSDIALAEYSLDDGTTWQPFAASFGNLPTLNVAANIGPFTAPDVLSICVRGTDSAQNQTVVCTLLAVYDPSAGFVTGGGWILSPLGAYSPNPTLTGKANFGFVSKYQNGATVPTGDTQFQFQVANLNFKSTVYEWLVVASARAQFKGSGTINGAGDYGFLLTAIDGQVPGGGGSDRFRIKIWNKASGGVIYDNQMGQSDTGDATTALGGGSVIIHN